MIDDVTKDHHLASHHELTEAIQRNQAIPQTLLQCPVAVVRFETGDHPPVYPQLTLSKPTSNYQSTTAPTKDRLYSGKSPSDVRRNSVRHLHHSIGPPTHNVIPISRIGVHLPFPR
ncbi:hypothetical protein BASA83_013310 [Batrachochytrium salamandrivorans]|nr:hypothetical protein BASA83_013310 [Batrachochytrium salamandrivorans]